MRMKCLKGLALASVAAIVLAAPAKAVPVDLELSLLIDVSGSVDANEFNLQRQGYVDAFNSQSLIDAIQLGTLKKIAVNVIYWSTSAVQSVGWTLVEDLTSSQALATAIGNAARPGSGTVGSSTGPGTAINYAAPLFDNNGYEGTRNVMDVSGDGSRNTGADTLAASTAFCGASKSNAINGVAILGSEANLDTWYANNIQCGTNSFTTAATGFDTFGKAIASKLQREIVNPPSAVPLPVPALMLLTGLGGLAAFRRRK